MEREPVNEITMKKKEEMNECDAQLGLIIHILLYRKSFRIFIIMFSTKVSRFHF